MKYAIGSVLVGFVVSMMSCGSYDPNATTELYLPDYETYKTELHPYLNRQCGTLDCHGQVGRPFRSYGTRGLRLFSPEARLVSGGADTYEEEYRASYESIIGLEPEAMRRVLACEQDPRSLLIYRKPTGTSYFSSDQRNIEGERHKGGTMTTADDPGADCIFSWLDAYCNDAGHFTGQAACAEARAQP